MRSKQKKDRREEYRRYYTKNRSRILAAKKEDGRLYRAVMREEAWRILRLKSHRIPDAAD